MKPAKRPIGRMPVALKPTVNVPTPKESLLDRIEHDLEENGVKLFTNDNVMEDYLILPSDITDVPPQELGRYFNAFTQQKMWTRTLSGRVYAMLKEESGELDRKRDRIFANLPLKMSVKEKELHLANNPECTKIIENLEFYKQKHEILCDYLENLVDGIFNISREISRRSADLDDSNRGHNLSNNRRH